MKAEISLSYIDLQHPLKANMWKQIEAFLGLSKVTDTVTDAPPLTKRGMAHEAVLLLQAKIDENAKINYRSAGDITVTSCRPNMLDLYEHLVEVNSIIADDGVLTPNDVFGEVSTYSIKSMMIKDNFFLPHDVVRFFCAQSKLLCEQLEGGDGRTSGKLVHNARVLTMQLGTIREVSLALLHCYPEQ